MEVEHFLHNHPLVLRDDDDDDEGRKRLDPSSACSICEKPLTGPAYQCNFAIHDMCMEVSRYKHVNFHGNHRCLVFGEITPLRTVDCCVCNDKMKRFGYYCPKDGCRFHVHLECATSTNVHNFHAPEEERRIVRDLMAMAELSFKEGKLYYVVSSRYTGGPALPRKMISQGASSKKQLNIEVYPLRLRILDSRDYSEFTIRLSKKASLHELYNRVCSLRGTDLEKAYLWDYFNKRKHMFLTNSNKTLEESDLQMDQEVLLELKS